MAYCICSRTSFSPCTTTTTLTDTASGHEPLAKVTGAIPVEMSVLATHVEMPRMSKCEVPLISAHVENTLSSLCPAIDAPSVQIPSSPGLERSTWKAESRGAESERCPGSSVAAWGRRADPQAERRHMLESSLASSRSRVSVHGTRIRD
ncbi:hypothetical protein Y032_0002g847 [Ancylostoma ceylanicum]|uniref:Uncharacterized protein n=1 Tax=Ancylostoma ceylanicum TaxID=53326 RepID=A0A016W1W3_9BILA|nr:hypothetical protein Y032_0002g847 [Ancylostoma ceylanicum]